MASRDQWFKARGAKIMAPCTCILDDGSTCGTPTRVRIGREYQAESGGAPPGPDCKRAGRIPQSGKRSPAGRENMSKAREALFVHPRTLLAHTLAEQGAERLGAFLRSGAAMVKRQPRPRRGGRANVLRDAREAHEERSEEPGGAVAELDRHARTRHGSSSERSLLSSAPTTATRCGTSAGTASWLALEWLHGNDGSTASDLTTRLRQMILSVTRGSTASRCFDASGD